MAQAGGSERFQASSASVCQMGLASALKCASEQTESCKQFLAQQPVAKANNLSTCERRVGGDCSPLGGCLRLGGGTFSGFGLWFFSGSFCGGGFPLLNACVLPI